MKFGNRVRLKLSNYRGAFELGRTRSKNDIAEKFVCLHWAKKRTIYDRLVIYTRDDIPCIQRIYFESISLEYMCIGMLSKYIL